MKRSKSKTSKTRSEEVVEKPKTSQGHISVQLSDDEIAAMTQLFNICQRTFEDLANNILAMEQDVDTAQVLMSRSKLCGLFANKFRQYAIIGEPDSRKLH